MHELTEGLKFIALSYTWGIVFSNEVVVNGQGYHIIDNLFTFLAPKSVDDEFCSGI